MNYSSRTVSSQLLRSIAVFSVAASLVLVPFATHGDDFLGYGGTDTNIGYGGYDNNLGYGGSDTNLGYGGYDTNLGYGGYVAPSTSLGYGGTDTNLGYGGYYDPGTATIGSVAPGTATIGSVDPGTATIGSAPVYSTYDVYAQTPYYASTPYYDYGGCGYGCGYGSLAFGAGLGFGYPMFYPVNYSYPVNYPVYNPPSTVNYPIYYNPPKIVDQSTTVVDQSTTVIDQSSYVYTYTADNSVNIVNSGNTTVTNVTNNPDPSVVVVTQPSPTYTYVAPVTYAAPQYTVQAYLPSYTYSYPYNYPPPSCSITASNNYGFGNLTAGSYYNTYRIGQAVLSWNSNNASSAYISPSVGAVSTAGSTTVYPTGNQTYTLTVNGSGGTATCQTTVYPYNYAYTAPVISSASNYTMPAAPYVALTQIPYTGFDFGPFGNALYWLGMILFAVAGAYLVLYFIPRLISGRENSLAFAGTPNVLNEVEGANAASPAKTETRSHAAMRVSDEARAEKTIERAERARGEPVESAAEARSYAAFGTKDAMTVEKSSNGGAPRIVIVRA